MYFKLTSRNPFRELARHAKRVATSNLTDEDKLSAYSDLHKLLHKRLVENERFLNSQAAFSKRAEHWNMRDVESIRPVTNTKNPWLRFKRMFEQAIKTPDTAVKAISTELMWFGQEQYLEDWIND